MVPRGTRSVLCPALYLLGHPLFYSYLLLHFPQEPLKLACESRGDGVGTDQGLSEAKVGLAHSGFLANLLASLSDLLSLCFGESGVW